MGLQVRRRERVGVVVALSLAVVKTLMLRRLWRGELCKFANRRKGKRG